MNALDRIFVTGFGSSAGARFLGVAATAALLTSCAGGPIASVKVAPGSPVAPEVARMAREAKTYPRFSDIPPEPTDVRAPQVYGARAGALVAARDQLDAATAPNTWTLGNTQGFVGGARRDAGPDLPPVNSDAAAFANTVRKRATQPPPTNP
ncbi:MAG TPA: hypothetical protein VIR81_10630 [Myxococcales bacterium]